MKPGNGSRVACNEPNGTAYSIKLTPSLSAPTPQAEHAVFRVIVVIGSERACTELIKPRKTGRAAQHIILLRNNTRLRTSANVSSAGRPHLLVCTFRAILSGLLPTNFAEKPTLSVRAQCFYQSIHPY